MPAKRDVLTPGGKHCPLHRYLTPGRRYKNNRISSAKWASILKNISKGKVTKKVSPVRKVRKITAKKPIRKVNKKVSPVRKTAKKPIRKVNKKVSPVRKTAKKVTRRSPVRRLPQPRKDFSLRTYGYHLKNSNASRKASLAAATRSLVVGKGMSPHSAAVLVKRRLNLIRNLTAVPKNKAILSSDISNLKTGGGIKGLLGKSMLSKRDKETLKVAKAAKVMGAEYILPKQQHHTPTKPAVHAGGSCNQAYMMGGRHRVLKFAMY